MIHFHFYQRMDSDEQYHLYYSISYKDKVTIKESRMGLELDNKVWEMALAEDIQRKDRWYYDLIFVPSNIRIVGIIGNLFMVNVA